MEKSSWKTIAILESILIIAIVLLGIWGVKSQNKETERENHCFYNICGEYNDAEYLDKVCVCYDYDVLGQLKRAKTEYMV